MRESLFSTLESYFIFRFLLHRMDITAKVGLVCFAELVTCTGKVFRVTKPRQADLKLVLL